MHGNARCRKDNGIDNNKLYAWSDASECQNKRGVPKFVESSVNNVTWVSGDRAAIAGSHVEPPSQRAKQANHRLACF